MPGLQLPMARHCHVTYTAPPQLPPLSSYNYLRPTPPPPHLQATIHYSPVKIKVATRCVTFNTSATRYLIKHK